MEVRFRTKAESNQDQEKAFLALSPVERFYEFLDLMWVLKEFPSQGNAPNDNFVIQLNTDAGQMEE